MTAYCLHATSAVHQCKRPQEAIVHLEDVIQRLEALLPLLILRRVELLYDTRLDGQASLCASHPLPQLANQLKPDLKRLWFVYVKNRARQIHAPHVQVVVSDLPAKSAQISVAAAEPMTAEGSHWLSFAGVPTFGSNAISVQVGANTKELSNSHSLTSMRNDWLVYEASPKHRLDEYERDGVVVSPMDLGTEDAQHALLISLVHGGSRFCYVRGYWYRFLPSGGDARVYHGFRISASQVPSDLAPEMFGSQG